MEESVDRKERVFIRLVLGGLVGFVLFVFLCWGGCRLSDRFQAGRLARRGNAYLAGGDLRAAALSARRSLQLERNADAMRVLARVAEHSNDRMALEWRRQVLELQPNSADDILALATAALQFGETGRAEAAIKSLDAGHRDTAPFLAIDAQIAESKNDLKEAEQDWMRACQLDPGNKTNEIGLALVQLRSDDASSREAGHTRLEKLRADQTHRTAATRALIADAVVHHRDGESVKLLARELQAYPEAGFTDRLLYLEVLRATKDDAYPAYFTKLEEDAKSSPLNLTALISWMNKSGMALVALDYARGIGKEICAKWPVPSELVNSYIRLADWRGLEQFTKDVTWPQLDFIRRAYLARALREQGKDEQADREWAGVEKEALTDPKYLEVLERKTVEWSWNPEAVELLWQLSKMPEKQIEALQSLYKHYAQERDTQGLYRVLSRLRDLKPDDHAVRNNFAQIALLLNADPVRARKIAEDLHREEPNNGAYASTYAFALYEQGNVGHALQVMNSLPQDQLADPGTSAYFGIFLAAAGEKNKAEKFLETGKEARLLPEEKALVEQAEQSLR